MRKDFSLESFNVGRVSTDKMAMGSVVDGYKCVLIIKTVLCLMTSPRTDYRIELFFSGKMFNVHLILYCHLVGMIVFTSKITLIHSDQLEQFKC